MRKTTFILLFCLIFYNTYSQDVNNIVSNFVQLTNDSIVYQQDFVINNKKEFKIIRLTFVKEFKYRLLLVNPNDSIISNKTQIKILDNNNLVINEMIYKNNYAYLDLFCKKGGLYKVKLITNYKKHIFCVFHIIKYGNKKTSF